MRHCALKFAYGLVRDVVKKTGSLQNSGKSVSTGEDGNFQNRGDPAFGE